MRIQILDGAEVERAVTVMVAIGANFGGLRGPVALGAFCADAVDRAPHRPGPTVITATERSETSGYILAVVDPNLYWPRFLWSNPALAVEAARARLRRWRRWASRRGEGGFLSMPHHRARALHLGVLPAYRRQGVGVALYMSLCDQLRREGVRVVSASLAVDNEASLRMHRALGFTLARAGNAYSATKQL